MERGVLPRGPQELFTHPDVLGVGVRDERVSTRCMSFQFSFHGSWGFSKIQSGTHPGTSGQVVPVI